MKTLLLLCLALPLIACTAKVEAEAQTNGDTSAALADMAVASGTHNVKCGCSIEGIGRCGNYIEVETQFVEIANGSDLGLGVMEWCSSGPAEAVAAGEIKDGKFIASAFEVK